MEMLVGTSGYSYMEWKGAFYPDGTKPADMLTQYASQLPAVEINNTFYRMPTEKVLHTWAEQTPGRSATHDSPSVCSMARVIDCRLARNPCQGSGPPRRSCMLATVYVSGGVSGFSSSQ
jgi:hypothetical protein